MNYAPREGATLSKQHNALFLILLSSAVAYSLYILTLSWSHSFTDLHPLRQYQTALTIRSLINGGPWLAYETPLFGAPWSIPFEFPLYQWIVAAVAWSVDISIEHASRGVSVLFYYLAILMTDRTLSLWRVSVVQRYCVMILMLTSPLYLFWSRTCLIESLALFLSISYVYSGSVILRGNRSVLALVFAGVIGALAATTKITTFYGCSILLAILTLYTAKNSHSLTRFKWMLAEYKLLCGILFLCCILPLSATYLWTLFSDIQKASAPLSQWLVSSELGTHNFGTLEQRLSAELWTETVAGILRWAIGDPKVLLVALLALLVTKQPAYLFAFSFSVFLLTVLTFTNLYIVHNYYPYATAVFIILAASSGIAAVFYYRGKFGVYCGLIFLTVVTLNNIYTYNKHYYPLITIDRQAGPILLATKSLTPEDSIVIVQGADWSSEIPYLINRRVIMNRARLPMDSEPMQRTLDALSDSDHIGGVLNCFRKYGEENHETLLPQLSFLGLATTPVMTHASRWPPSAMGCELYVSQDVLNQISLEAGNQAQPNSLPMDDQPPGTARGEGL